jgi:hypothetical protein
MKAKCGLVCEERGTGINQDYWNIFSGLSEKLEAYNNHPEPFFKHLISEYIKNHYRNGIPTYTQSIHVPWDKIIGQNGMRVGQLEDLLAKIRALDNLAETASTFSDPSKVTRQGLEQVLGQVAGIIYNPNYNVHTLGKVA